MPEPAESASEARAERDAVDSRRFITGLPALIVRTTETVTEREKDRTSDKANKPPS